MLDYKEFVINCNSALRNLAAWSAGLGVVIAFGMASSPLAQAGGVQQHSAPVSGQESDKKDQKNPPSKDDGSSVVQDAPGQPDSLPGNACADQESVSCEEVAPVREGFLRKLLRILYGPDTPPGPNPDVDTNISAGGAGGG